MTSPANAGPPARQQPADLPPAEPRPGRTILLAENDPLVQRLAQTVLTQNGYRVVTAVDGREAVEVYRSTPLDVVLMDLHMPVLSGLDAAAQLQGIDPGVRIVLTSGAPPEVLPASCGFLPKPYRPAELLAAVASALSGQPGTQPQTGGQI